MRGRRLWMKVAAHGSTIPVYVVKELLDEETGKALAGIFYPDGPSILIAQVKNVSAMKQTLHHEILHVCFRGHSGTTREQILASKTEDGRAKREEEIISFLEPVQYDIMVRNGWLRYPNPPKVK